VLEVFEAELSDVSLLRDSMDAIADLIDEAGLNIKEDGIEIIASDRAVVAVVDFMLNKTAFDTYNYDKSLKLGVNFSSLMQVLKRHQSGEKLKISADDSKIILNFEGDVKRNFVLPVINVSKEETPDLVKLESGFTARMRIDSNVLNHGVEDAELIGDSIVFTVRNDMVIMDSESDSSSSKLELHTGSDALEIDKIGEPVRSRYSIDYMKKILKAKKIADKVSISLSSEYPIKMQFDVPDKLKLAFILAPRVEEG
jgi:proliferating cell nuclear antigen